MKHPRKKIVIAGAGTAGLVSALILKERYPDFEFQIVKSGKIGIIGVGEGSTEHWRNFMEFVGIPFDELVHKTKATVKIGILFKDWNLGERYVHSISSLEGAITPFGRLESLNNLLVHNKNEFKLSPSFDAIFSKNNVPITPGPVSNQLHFDTFRLNEYLISLCELRGIPITDHEITSVEVDPETGNVTRLFTAATGGIMGDFFIDCTGFKRILAEKINNKWESKVDFLPLNRAIAFPTEQNPSLDIEPYTTSTALSSGWAWRIPTQDRYGNGYVFNSSYITPDKALEEISKSLGVKNIQPSRDIPFEAGKVNKFWKQNVLHVGLSGSFAEPLEAQSIGFTIIQMFEFLKYFDLYEYDAKAQEQYNTVMDDVFQNVIDYLQAHYLVKRDDSKFWKDKPFKLTDFNETYMEAFKQGEVLPVMFEKPSLMFRASNWYQVLGGTGVIERINVINNFSRNRRDYNEKHKNITYIEAKKNYETPFMSHRAYLQTISHNYLNKVFFEAVND